MTLYRVLPPTNCVLGPSLNPVPRAQSNNSLKVSEYSAAAAKIPDNCYLSKQISKPCVLNAPNLNCAYDLTDPSFGTISAHADRCATTPEYLTMYRFTLCSAVSLLLFTASMAHADAERQSSTSAEDTTQPHPQVREALAWTLPVNACKKPKPPGQRKAIFDNDGVSREEWDVDYYTLKRYKRKEQRWEKCVDDYKNGLKKDFHTLRNSASYGLTQIQANTILGKMKIIQTVMESAEGLPPESQEVATN